MNLAVYSRRWGHNENYNITLTETGWNIFFLQTGGNSDRQGAPGFFECLNHDSINYPAALGQYLEWLWNIAHDQNMSVAA